jgi:DNA-binding SARP family transcriptional activator
MYRFTMFGAMDLTHSEGHRVQSVLSQPKRLALLAYLALEGRGRPVGRDRILAVFWPECDDATARNRLKRAVHFLRRSLGPGVLPRDPSDSLHLDPSAFSSDVADFWSAFDAGRWAEALALYTGELLPGFHLDHCREFDAWLESQRCRVRAAAADAGMKAAGLSVEADDLPTAQGLVRRALEIDPGASRLREALQVLARAGDSVGIADVYAVYERRLAEELGLEPDEVLRTWVAELLEKTPGSDPRDDDAKEAPGPGMSRTSAERPGGAPEGRLAPLALASRSRRTAGLTRAVLATTVTALLLASAIVLGWERARNASAHILGDGPYPLLIQPFEACDDSLAMSQARLLSAMLSHHLAQGARPVVRAVESAPTGLAGAVESPYLVVNGLIRRLGEEMVADLALTHSESGEVLWARSVTWLTESPGLDGVARSLASDLAVAMDRQMRARRSLAAGVPPEALELTRLAEEAQRHARANRSHGLLDVADLGFGEADSLLARAAAVAPDWIEPLVSRARLAGDRGWSALTRERPDTGAARRHFTSGLGYASGAVDRDAGNAEAYEIRGFLADRMAAAIDLESRLRAELLDTARADLERAVALDRTRVRAWSLLSGLAFREADFARALWLAGTAYEIEPNHPHARELLMRLVSSAYELGDDAAAEAWCRMIRNRFRGEPTAAFCQLSLMAWSETGQPGEVDAAWQVLGEVDARGGAPLQPYLQMLVASVLARAALIDSAEAVVQRAALQGGGDLEFLHLEAHVRTVLGQRDSATALLDRWVMLNPSAHEFMARSRRFSALNPPVTDG